MTPNTFRPHGYRQYSANNQRSKRPTAVSMQRSPASRSDLYESNETKACFTVTQHLEDTVSYIAGVTYHCQTAFVSTHQSPLERYWGGVPFHGVVCLGSCTSRSKMLCLRREQITSVSPLFTPWNTSTDGSLGFKMHCHLVALRGGQHSSRQEDTDSPKKVVSLHGITKGRSLGIVRKTVARLKSGRFQI